MQYVRRTHYIHFFRFCRVMVASYVWVNCNYIYALNVGRQNCEPIALLSQPIVESITPIFLVHEAIGTHTHIYNSISRSRNNNNDSVKILIRKHGRQKTQINAVGIKTTIKLTETRRAMTSRIIVVAAFCEKLARYTYYICIGAIFNCAVHQ